MNRRMILYLLGRILTVEAALMAPSAALAAIYGEGDLSAFLISMALLLAVGLPLSVNKPENSAIYAREGLVTVALAWVLMSAFGALPMVISGAIPSYVDALFEIVSGFTTTGSSILTDVEALSHASLFWRSFTLDRRYGDPGLCCRNVKRCQRIDPAHSQSRDARSNCRQACF